MVAFKFLVAYFRESRRRSVALSLFGTFGFTYLWFQQTYLSDGSGFSPQPLAIMAVALMAKSAWLILGNMKPANSSACAAGEIPSDHNPSSKRRHFPDPR